MDISTLPQHDGVRYALVPEFPWYAVGTDGSFWTCLEDTNRSKGRKLGSVWRQKSSRRKDNYIRVMMMNEYGKEIDKPLHAVILESFVGPRPPGMQCCHYDGDKRNNRLENLRWDTPKNNSADKYRHGTMIQGLKSSQAKINDDIVRVIRAAMGSGGASSRVVSRALGLSRTLVRMIKDGDAWPHVLQESDELAGESK